MVRSPRHGQPSSAHPAEARDEVMGVGAGELDGVFAQAGQALGQVGHRRAVVAVVLGRAGEQFLAEALQRLFRLGVACEVQRAEAPDDVGEAVERPLVDEDGRLVEGGEYLFPTRVGMAARACLPIRAFVSRSEG